MAVYDRAYRRYEGPLTPERWRFLVLPRYAYEEILKSKIFIAFLVLCCVPFIAEAVIVYLHHNLSAMRRLELPLDRLIPIDARFFREFVVGVQSAFAFFLALFVGPGLVSPDLRNNALPLYLSRPFSRSEYVLGKLAVLLILLSAITWLPGILLFALQSYLAGLGWLRDNLWIGGAVLASSLVWIVILSLLTLAISAWVKWKPVARITLLALFFVLRGWAEALNATFHTDWGGLVSLMRLNETVRDWLFRAGPLPGAPPVWSAWLGLAAVCALSLWLLSRRVRAYEVVR
jgi:ABC-2 type transport system permease protein